MKRKSNYHHVKIVGIRRGLILNLIKLETNVGDEYKYFQIINRFNTEDLKKNLEL